MAPCGSRAAQAISGICLKVPWCSAQRWMLVGLTVLVAWGDAASTEPAVLFEDDFEIVAETTAPHPTVGKYEVFKAEVVRLSDLDSDVASTAAAGRAVQLMRSEKLSTGARRVVARLDQPVPSGRQVRLEFDARLDHGSALQFGFGSKEGGVAVSKDVFFTILISLSDKGRVSVYNGIKYERIPDLEASPGRWQHYTLDFLVGSEEITLRAGENTAVITGPFAENVIPVTSVDQVFFSTAADEVTGEFDNVRVTLIEDTKLSALPVFGKIVWQREHLPFVKKGPKAGISGVGMCAVGNRVFVAGGFLGKGAEGDGSLEPNRRTSKWVHAYDVKTGNWHRWPDLPTRAEYGRMVAVGGKLFFAGGASYANEGDKVGAYRPSAAVYMLDLADAVPRWHPLPPLPEPRTHFAFGHVGNRLVAVGGNVYDAAEKGYSARTIRNETAVFEISTPAAGWILKRALPGPSRGWTATVTCREKLWIFGGLTFREDGSSNSRVRLPETLSYDPAEDSWTRHTSAPVEISGWGAAAYLDRYVILVGGHGGPAGRKPRMNVTPLVYDTVDDRWLRLEQSATPTGGVLNDPGVALVDNSIYVAGAEGYGGSHFNYWLIGRIERAN